MGDPRTGKAGADHPAAPGGPRTGDAGADVPTTPAGPRGAEAPGDPGTGEDGVPATPGDPHARLAAAVAAYPRLAVAVSGGVDSMTLAHVAHAVTDATMVHAASPAVPPEATGRVVAHAARYGWRLTVADAGEFDDPRYRSNPYDRCYFCKSNLYARIAGLTDRTIASGANLDDLGEHRPGLVAAKEHGVVHPHVEAGLSKADVRAVARALGLADIADLPAQPCLASRVETGIAIAAADLAFIHRVETAVRQAAPHLADVRCRIFARGVVLEVADGAGDLAALVRAMAEADGRTFAGVATYRRGAAFVEPRPLSDL